MDCGDNSCEFAEKIPGKMGMRTNGGCRCLAELPADKRREITGTIRFLRSELRRERDEWPNQLAAALGMSADQAGRTPSMIAGHIKALRAKVAELDQQAARDKARIDRLEALLQEAMKREYNSFEPDNQSAHYKRLQAALNRKEADRA